VQIRKGLVTNKKTVRDCLRQMHWQSFPTELDRGLTFNETEKLRNLHCIFYDVCLHYAALKGWVSFVCTSCSLKDTKPPERVD
jgi:hypothetical protein